MNSVTSSQSKPKYSFAKNKVGSPPFHSPTTSVTRDSENSDVFLAKNRNFSKPPIPKPRRSKILKNRTPSPDISEYSSTNYDSKSDPKSYRERIKERFQSVKQHAGQSATIIEKLPRLKGESKRIINLNKSIDAIKRENVEINADVKRHTERARDDQEITRRDKYNFFCETSKYNEENIVEENEFKLNGNLNDECSAVFQRPENLEFLLELAQSEVIWIPKR